MPLDVDILRPQRYQAGHGGLQQAGAQALAGKLALHHRLADITLGQAAAIRRLMGMEVVAQVDADEPRQPPFALAQHRLHASVGYAAQMGLHPIGREEVPGVRAVFEEKGAELGDVPGACQAQLQFRRHGSQSSRLWKSAV
ncbi:hypothetical protein D3C72_1797920 [compost metagenome]